MQSVSPADLFVGRVSGAIWSEWLAPGLIPAILVSPSLLSFGYPRLREARQGAWLKPMPTT